MLNPSVLVVEDEDALRKLVCRLLERAGWQVENASHGLEGLDRYASGIFHLVITDLDMPGLGGIEMIRQIHLKNPSQRVLIMTGRPDNAPPGWPCLAKPFMPKELLDRVGAFVTNLALGGAG